MSSVTPWFVTIGQGPQTLAHDPTPPLDGLAAAGAHPEVPKERWLLLTVHRQDGRANLYGWKWSDGHFSEVRREHTARARLLCAGPQRLSLLRN